MASIHALLRETAQAVRRAAPRAAVLARGAQASSVESGGLFLRECRSQLVETLAAAEATAIFRARTLGRLALAGAGLLALVAPGHFALAQSSSTSTSEQEDESMSSTSICPDTQYAKERLDVLLRNAGCEEPTCALLRESISQSSSSYGGRRALTSSSLRLASESNSIVDTIGYNVVADQHVGSHVKVGAGSFANVYQAKYAPPTPGPCAPEAVAVKVLHKTAGTATAKFLEEAAVLHLVEHPGIVRSYGVGVSVTSGEAEEEVRPYIVQEFAEHGTLAQMLLEVSEAAAAPYTWREGLGWMQDIASALAYLHGLRPTMVIHRDLKPENILLCSGAEGERRVAKLGDFGLVKQVLCSHTGLEDSSHEMSEAARSQPATTSAANPRKSKAPVTKRGGGWRSNAAGVLAATARAKGYAPVVVDASAKYALTGETGSMLYMAPEVAASRRYNEAVDTYAFGLMLYEVLHYTMVVLDAIKTCGNDIPQIEFYVRRMRQGMRPDASRLPPALADLVAACWHQDPERRPPMADVAAALDALQAHPDVLAHDVGMIVSLSRGGTVGSNVLGALDGDAEPPIAYRAPPEAAARRYDEAAAAGDTKALKGCGCVIM